MNAGTARLAVKPWPRRRGRQTACAGLALALMGAPPVPAQDADALAAAARDYQRYCAACHGVAGHGDGPVAPALAVRPADLTRIQRDHRGVYPAARVHEVIDGRAEVVAHGPRTMPVWGFKFLVPGEAGAPGAEQALSGRIHALTEYLRTLQSAD